MRRRSGTTGGCDRVQARPPRGAARAGSAGTAAGAGGPPGMQIRDGILGQRRLTEWEADWLPGYEGARPVRIGNAAHAQLQLDVFGELMDVFHQSREANLKLSEPTWALECELLEHLGRIWNETDAGIWE